MSPPQSPKCNNTSCKQDTPKDLLSCSGCKLVWYCSRGCQKQDWSSHKNFCKHIATNGASSKSFNLLAYYRKVALHDPRVKVIAHDMRITLPAPTSSNLYLPLRRLVITGKDTPENLSLFFGKDMSILQIHSIMRIDILMRSPPGSPLFVVAAQRNADENCPPWTPREPSTAEAKEIEDIKAMQEKIRSHMGDRGVKNHSPRDMREILTQKFGGDFGQDKVDLYYSALNVMDQEVPENGYFEHFFENDQWTP